MKTSTFSSFNCKKLPDKRARIANASKINCYDWLQVLDSRNQQNWDHFLIRKPGTR